MGPAKQANNQTHTQNTLSIGMGLVIGTFLTNSKKMDYQKGKTTYSPRLLALENVCECLCACMCVCVCVCVCVPLNLIPVKILP